MTQTFRRIVTGHDAKGRSIVIADGVASNKLGSLTTFWTTGAAPADITAADPTLGEPIGLEPVTGGTAFRFFQIAPQKELDLVPGDILYEQARKRFAEMGAAHALVDTTRHPAMHKTQTIDYIVLLSGSVTLLLDDGDVPMQPFDVVIQRGTNHAWVNTGDEVATMMAVLVDAAS